MGDVIRMPTVSDFPFMPAQNVNMGAVLGHLQNFLHVYKGASESMWRHFEADLAEHISGFLGMSRTQFPERPGEVLLEMKTRGSMGRYQYSVVLCREFFKV